jgi:hypothetical protein
VRGHAGHGRLRVGAAQLEVDEAVDCSKHCTFFGFYDIALRDFGLLVGALALTRLAWHYER